MVTTETPKVTETVVTTAEKQDSGRPIGERQSPDGQEEPKSDNLALKASCGKDNIKNISPKIDQQTYISLQINQHFQLKKCKEKMVEMVAFLVAIYCHGMHVKKGLSIRQPAFKLRLLSNLGNMLCATCLQSSSFKQTRK